MPQISRRRLLQTAGAAVTAAFAGEFLPPNVRRALAAGPSPGGSLSDIKHVVILMQENRSFDHYFGTLPNVRGFADPQAITLPDGKSVFYQPDPDNPDGYLLPYHLDTRTTSAQAAVHQPRLGGAALGLGRRQDGQLAARAPGRLRAQRTRFCVPDVRRTLRGGWGTTCGPTWLSAALDRFDPADRSHG